MKRRDGYNPKRRVCAYGDVTEDVCETWAESASYGGNPEHKTKPSDFGLTPPTNPRAGKTLCDKARDFSKADALQLLNSGFVRHMVSLQKRGGWPQNVWAVIDDEAYEAQLENPVQGVYHGDLAPRA